MRWTFDTVNLKKISAQKRNNKVCFEELFFEKLICSRNLVLFEFSSLY